MILRAIAIWLSVPYSRPASSMVSLKFYPQPWVSTTINMGRPPPPSDFRCMRASHTNLMPEAR